MPIAHSSAASFLVSILHVYCSWWLPSALVVREHVTVSCQRWHWVLGLSQYEKSLARALLTRHTWLLHGYGGTVVSCTCHGWRVEGYTPLGTPIRRQRQELMYNLPLYEHCSFQLPLSAEPLSLSYVWCHVWLDCLRNPLGSNKSRRICTLGHESRVIWYGSDKL